MFRLSARGWPAELSLRHSFSRNSFFVRPARQQPINIHDLQIRAIHSSQKPSINSSKLIFNHKFPHKLHSTFTQFPRFNRNHATPRHQQNQPTEPLSKRFMKYFSGGRFNRTKQIDPQLLETHLPFSTTLRMKDLRKLTPYDWALHGIVWVTLTAGLVNWYNTMYRELHQDSPLHRFQGYIDRILTTAPHSTLGFWTDEVLSIQPLSLALQDLTAPLVLSPEQLSDPKTLLQTRGTLHAVLPRIQALLLKDEYAIHCDLNDISEMLIDVDDELLTLPQKVTDLVSKLQLLQQVATVQPSQLQAQQVADLQTLCTQMERDVTNLCQQFHNPAISQHQRDQEREQRLHLAPPHIRQRERIRSRRLAFKNGVNNLSVLNSLQKVLYEISIVNAELHTLNDAGEMYFVKTLAVPLAINHLALRQTSDAFRYQVAVLDNMTHQFHALIDHIDRFIPQHIHQQYQSIYEQQEDHSQQHQKEQQLEENSLELSILPPVAIPLQQLVDTISPETTPQEASQVLNEVNFSKLLTLYQKQSSTNSIASASLLLPIMSKLSILLNASHDALHPLAPYYESFSIDESTFPHLNPDREIAGPWRLSLRPFSTNMISILQSLGVSSEIQREKTLAEHHENDNQTVSDDQQPPQSSMLNKFLSACHRNAQELPHSNFCFDQLALQRNPVTSTDSSHMSFEQLCTLPLIPPDYPALAQFDESTQHNMRELLFVSPPRAKQVVLPRITNFESQI